jgi:hypothetical protein
MGTYFKSVAARKKQEAAAREVAAREAAKKEVGL